MTSQHRRPRALVADDDVAIRVLVCRILARNGFDVDAVPDGAEAIEHVLAHDYAVVILDLMMPRLDGFKVIEYLSSHVPDVLARVLVVTAFGASTAGTVAELVGACIEKPFEVNNLAEKAKALARIDQPPRVERKRVIVTVPDEQQDFEFMNTEPGV